MSLATIGNDGLWNTAVFYASNAWELYFVSSPDTRHCRNITDNPQVAVTIQEDYDNWKSIKGIQVQAKVEKVEEGEIPGVIDLYKKKFSFFNDATQMVEKITRALEKSSWYRVVPSTVYFVNNEKGFGNRTEIDIKDQKKDSIL